MLTTGQKVIKFIESYLIVPEGDLVGQPVRLADFQKDFIIAIFDNPHITDTAILSMARKNGKTALIAFIVISFLVGPVAIQNSRIISGAMSLDQAGEVFNLASKCVNISPRLEGLVHIVPASKRMVGLPMNVEYKAISAEGKTAHGKSPMVAILDEVGQIRGPNSDFVDAITTSQGAYSNALLIYISTQAATDADFFSILIDDAKQHKPPKQVCHVYEAPHGCELNDKDGWYAANPLMGKGRSVSEFMKQQEKAERMPSFANTFRNLNLNQRVSVFAPFIPVDGWKKSLCREGIPAGLPIHCGLDLSKRTDLTAFTMSAFDGETLHAETYFWTPEEGLQDREDRDRRPYSLWVEQGFLRTTPGPTVDYDFVIAEILELTAGREIVKIGFDPWRIDILLKAAGEHDLKLVEFAQGFKTMSPALERLEELILKNRLRHLVNPVQTMCAGNATTKKIPSGERMLDKMKSTGRIDGMVSLAISIGVMKLEELPQDEDLSDYINDPIIFSRTK